MLCTDGCTDWGISRGSSHCRPTLSWDQELIAPSGPAFAFTHGSSVKSSPGPTEVGPGRTPWHKVQKSPCQREGEAIFVASGRRTRGRSQQAVCTPRFRNPRGRKEACRPTKGQRRPSYRLTHTGSSQCALCIHLIKTLVTDITGPRSGHWGWCSGDSSLQSQRTWSIQGRVL